MADAVTSQTLADGDRIAVMKFTNLSDGTGMRVALEWNATTNVVAAVLGGSAAAGNVSGHMDFRSFGGIKNTEASGADGDIDLTTSGHTNLDHYTVVLQLRKSY